MTLTHRHPASLLHDARVHAEGSRGLTDSGLASY